MKRFAVALCALAACGDNQKAYPDFDATVGNFAVHVDGKGATLSISDWQGHVLLDGVPGGLSVAHADESYETHFGAFKIAESGRVDTAVAGAYASARADGGVDLVLLDKHGAAVASGTIDPGAEGELVVKLVAEPSFDRVDLAVDCAADEHFLGFGGQSYDVDHRGQRVPIWVSEDGIGKDPDDADSPNWLLVGRRHSTHSPMPIYLSSRGYALAVNTTRRSIFDMCAARADAVTVETWAPTMELHLFGGPAPADALRRLTTWTGRPTMPPPFTFAPWLDALHGSANVRRVAQKLRQQGVPSSVIWTEDFRGGAASGDDYVLEEDWNIDRALYPDFEQVADDLHADGFKWLVYENTFLDSTGDAFTPATTMGYSIHDATGGTYLFQGVKFNDATLLDLTNPAAVDWAKETYRAALVAGADGWMADFAEWLPTDAVLADGAADARDEHNLYPVRWQRLNRELLDDQSGKDGVERVFFVRSAYLGSQPLVEVFWPGDQQTDFSPGDGFPSVIPMAMGLGVTGFPFFGSDIGGYMSSGTVPTTRELWYRWVELGALSPVMRTHHGRTAFKNWNWESDDASTQHFARWATLHIRLFPYLRQMAQVALDDGLPLMRPLALAHPDFAPGWTATDQYMLGDQLYVAPVVTEGATARDVALPPGTYYPLLGGAAIVVAGAPIHVDAPLEDIPVFVRAGAALELLPDGVETLVGAITTDRELWLWPGGSTTTPTLAWQADGLTGPITSATWNGVAIAVTTPLEVDGAGTLVLNGGEATLTINSGLGHVTIRVQSL